MTDVAKIMIEAPSSQADTLRFLLLHEEYNIYEAPDPILLLQQDETFGGNATHSIKP